MSYRLLQWIWRYEKRPDYLVNQHKFFLIRNCPQQSNNYDCGPYCVAYVQYKLDQNLTVFDYLSNYKRYLLNGLLLETVKVSEPNPPGDFTGFDKLNFYRKRKITYNDLPFDKF